MNESLNAVVVCTRNRVDGLRRTLASIEVAHRRLAVACELVVVDNGSDDGTPAFLRAWTHEAPARRSLRLDEPGLGRARNAYAGECGEGRSVGWVAFTDDDVEVAPEWLSATDEFLQRHPEYAAATGPIRVPPQTSDPALLERLDLYSFKMPFRDEGDRVGEARLLIGANMAIRKAAFSRVGLFDERLGPGALGFNDDDEFGSRLRRAGLRLGYNPAAVVWHEVDATRLTLEAALDRAVRGARSTFAAYPQDYGRGAMAARYLEAALAFGLARVSGQKRRALKRRIRVEYYRELWRLTRQPPRSGA